MTPEMERVLAEAKAYGDWFSISHHFMSPVRARQQTVKALYRRGFLQHTHQTNRSPDGRSGVSHSLYRIKDIP